MKAVGTGRLGRRADSLRLSLLSSSVAFAALNVALSVQSALAQPADAPTATPAPEATREAAPGAVQLTPVTVETRRRQRPQAPRNRQPSPTVRTTPAPAPAPTEAVERANGPVPGFVAQQSASATKTDTPILETPQSISVVSRSQIEAQGSENLQEAIRYTPSTSIEPNGSSSQFDYIYIRGLEAPQYRDGLRLPADPPLGFARWRTEPYGLERIEVLRGPSSGIYGQGSPAGIISMVSKRPTETPFNEVLFQTGTYGRAQTAFDFSGPLDRDGTLLYRLTGLGRIMDSEIDFNGEKRAFLAPAFTWRPNTDTSFTFLSQFQRDDIVGPPQQYIPAMGSLLPNPNGHISRSLNVQDPSMDRLRRTEWSVGYAFEHRFNDVWQVRQNLRYASVDIGLRSMRGEGFISRNPENPQDPANFREVIRSDFFIPSSVRNFTVDTHAQGDFATGPLDHKLLLGVDYFNLRSSQTMWGDFGTATPIDIFAPVYARTINPMQLIQNYDQQREQVGVYAQDQIKLDRWILTLTGRQDFAETAYIDKVGSATTRKNSQAFTGRAALGYLFDNGVAPYVSYSTSFDPIAGADKAGNVFVPTTGESIEAGVKYQPTWLPKTLFTFAAFDIRQKNLTTPDPNPSDAANGFMVQTGEARIRGLEFEAKTSFTKGFNLVASASYLDPEITRSNAPAEIGKTLPQVPRVQAALWADYTLQEGPYAGFGLGGGVRYIGTTYSDTVNTAHLRIPAYTLFDAALYYDFGYRFADLKGLKLEVIASNLFDKEYVAACYGDAYCNYGAGRRVLATLRYRWQ